MMLVCACAALLCLAATVQAQPIGKLHAKRFREAGGIIDWGEAQQQDLQRSKPARLLSSSSPPPSLVAAQLRQAAAHKKLVITESLDNGLSEYQDDIEGQVTFGPGQGQAHQMPYHPTGNTIETLWNPFALGTNKPNATVPFTGPHTVVGLNKGFCISMTGGNDCGEWECHVHATFYNTTDSIVSCFPPSATCVATQAGNVLGTVQFSGIWPSCANPYVDFSFPLMVNGGTGPFAGVRGWVNATQYTDYHFTYEMHFD